jgi:hypothetical protein
MSTMSNRAAPGFEQKLKRETVRRDFYKLWQRPNALLAGNPKKGLSRN